MISDKNMSSLIMNDKEASVLKKWTSEKKHELEDQFEILEEYIEDGHKTEPIDPEDWEVSVLTKFPNHTDPDTDLPLAYAANPLNSDDYSNAYEFLAQIPPTKRDFRVQIKYVGSKNIPKTEKCVCWEIYMNGMSIDDKYMKIGPNSTHVVSTFQMYDKLYPLTFDPNDTHQHESSDSQESSSDDANEEDDDEDSQKDSSDDDSDDVGRDRFCVKRSSKFRAKLKPYNAFELEIVGMNAISKDKNVKSRSYGNSRLNTPYQLFKSSKITYTIHLCNSVKMINWGHDWDIDIASIYDPYPYEAKLITERPIVQSDGKRTVDKVSDIDEPTRKKKKTTEYDKWTVSQVGEWLRTLDPKYQQLGFDKLFENHEIDGSCLENLNLQILKTKVGIDDLGYRFKILKAIKELS